MTAATLLVAVIWHTKQGLPVVVGLSAIGPSEFATLVGVDLVWLVLVIGAFTNLDLAFR